jgi:hypothetical protein
MPDAGVRSPQLLSASIVDLAERLEDGLARGCARGRDGGPGVVEDAADDRLHVRERCRRCLGRSVLGPKLRLASD